MFSEKVHTDPVVLFNHIKESLNYESRPGAMCIAEDEEVEEEMMHLHQQRARRYGFDVPPSSCKDVLTPREKQCLEDSTSVIKHMFVMSVCAHIVTHIHNPSGWWSLL
jgi:hypothetical protein